MADLHALGAWADEGQHHESVYARRCHLLVDLEFHKEMARNGVRVASHGPTLAEVRPTGRLLNPPVDTTDLAEV